MQVLLIVTSCVFYLHLLSSLFLFPVTLVFISPAKVHRGCLSGHGRYRASLHYYLTAMNVLQAGPCDDPVGVVQNIACETGHAVWLGLLIIWQKNTTSREYQPMSQYTCKNNI